MFIIYLLFTLLFYIFTYCISFNKNTNNTLHDIKKHISLDDCILLFEKSKHKNLNDFSKSKMRTSESYRQIYDKFYLISKNKIKKNNI